MEIISLDQQCRKKMEFLNEGVNEIDIHELASGIYFVRIYHNDDPTISIKLVKTEN